MSQFHPRALRSLKFVWPYGSSAVVLVCGVVVYYLAARQFGVEGFSEYAISRRSISFVQPMLFQGFGLALTRQIAVTEASPGSRSPFSYLFVTMLVFAACCVAALTVANICPGIVSKAFFGSDVHRHCVVPLAFMLVGIALHGAAWAYWRGRMCIALACVLEALNLGLLPLVSFAVGHHPAAVLWWTGCLTTICSTAALAVIVAQEWSPLKSVGEHARELIQYALPRIPGALALAALLSLPAIICAHIADIRYAGFVAFGCSLLGMAGSLISPLGVVLLPQSTKMIAVGRTRDLKRLMLQMLLIGSAVSFLVVLVVELFAETTVAYLFKVNDADLVGIIRLMICSAVPFLIYLSLRSVLDGATHRALNSRNCVVALIFLLLFTGFSRVLGGGVEAILVGSIYSMSVLALLTLFEAYRVLEVPLTD